MAEKKSKISKLFDKYLAKMDAIKRDGDAPLLYNDLTKGKNAYMRIDRLASSSFDMTWINAIEDVLFDLGDIVKNPREVTKTEPVLVPVELARKVNSESVIHLASHTQYIKTVDENGDVVPNKIMNIANEEDIHTYENRFIATLIRRLVLFIEKRYEFIKSFAPIRDEQILYFKNSSIINGAEVEIETKVKIRAESEEEYNISSTKYISRIEDIRQYILYYYGSQFMKKMKTDRDVRNPIIMTNILRKNPKYHRCYELYRFIEKYQQLGVDFKVNENVSILSDEEIDELNTVAFTNYLALKDKDRSKKLKGFTKAYKPRILSSIDDEQFIYDDLLKGPFSFVRVDDPYQAYLDSKLKKDLPAHPTKVEREYYKEEYAAKKENKEDKIQLDKLKKRKSKDALEYEKKVQKIIAQREREEELRRQREAEAIRKEEERRLNEIRKQIIASARGEEVPKEEEPKEEVPTSVNENIATEESESKPKREYNISKPTEEKEVASIVSTSEGEVKREADPEIIKYIDSLFESLGETEDDKSSEISLELGKGKKRKIKSVKPVKDEDIESIFSDGGSTESKHEADPEIIKYIDSLFGDLKQEQDATPITIEGGTSKKKRRNIIEGIAPIEEGEDVESIYAEPTSESKREENPDVVKFIDSLFDQEEAKETPKGIALGGKKGKGKRHYDFSHIKVINDEDVPSIFASDVKEESKHQDNEDVIKFVDSLFEEEKEEQPKEDKEEKAAEKPVKEKKPSKKKKEKAKPQQEEPVVKTPIEEKPIEEAPKVEEAEPEVVETQIEEQPIEEVETPVEEKPEEEPVEEHPQEEPVKEAEISNEEPEVKEETPFEKQPKKAKAAKKARKKVEEKEPEPEAEPEEKIPGRFIVKTLEGYYCGPDKFSVYKHDAYIFDDFNAANKIKKELGGKVVKL